MENRRGVNGSDMDGVFFTESSIAGCTPIQHLHIEISRQNANLTDVKRELAAKARSLNANAIINFRYGQRAHPWWEQVFTFKWDTESWHGEGDAVTL